VDKEQVDAPNNPNPDSMGQPTRRFIADDLKDPKTLRYMRSRMGLTQREMASALGASNLRKYQQWEYDGMNQASDLLRDYVLLKFDMFLIAEKHRIGGLYPRVRKKTPIAGKKK